ncbi:MAG: HAD family hydrolase [Treponemataceae bacterium]
MKSSKFANIRGIFFDMDGVLLDTETICDRCWEIAGSEFGLENMFETTALCRGKSRKDTVETLKSIYTDKADSTINAFMERSHEIFTKIEAEEGIRNMYFAKECLEYLSSDYRLVLVSSTRSEHVFRQLKNAGLIDFFKKIITGDMVKHSKPDPEIYLKAVDFLGFKPEDCLAIEDSPNGILSAYKAGISVVMIPDKVAPNPELEKMCTAIYPNLQKLCLDL